MGRPSPRRPQRTRGAAVPIGEALTGWRRRLSGGGRASSGGVAVSLSERWAELLGDPWGHLSRPTSLRSGVLRVEVASSAVLSEFSALRKERILARVQAVCPQVSGLSFSVADGPWEGP